MEFFDLSHTIHNTMTVYPGTNQPEIKKTSTVETDGYCETSLGIESHTGTHIDAPAHMLATGLSLDRMPVSKFTGPAVIISVPQNTAIIKKPFLQKFEKEIAEADFILLKTGWADFWGSENYFRGFPVFSEETARWLCSFNLKGIGIDAISFDPVGANDWPNHYLFFENGLILIENLNFPSELTAKTGTFFCFPLKFTDADGSPARAVFAAG